jgi:hypothetical protein
VSNTQQLIFELRSEVQDVHFRLELLDRRLSLAMDAKQEHEEAPILSMDACDEAHPPPSGHQRSPCLMVIRFFVLVLSCLRLCLSKSGLSLPLRIDRQHFVYAIFGFVLRMETCKNKLDESTRTESVSQGGGSASGEPNNYV